MMLILKKLFEKGIQDIDSGNCNMSDSEVEELVNLILKYANREEYLSKELSRIYIGVSRSTFDNLVKQEKLPKGKKKMGWTELGWLKSDLDNYLKSHPKKDRIINW